MPITRKLLAQDDSSENSVLKIDSATRYIENNCSEWQFLFNTTSTLSASTQVFKLSGEFDTNTFAKIRLAGYLFNTESGSVDAAATCQFTVYSVANSTPTWNDTLLTSVSGSVLSNNYYYAEVLLSSIPSANLDGDTTLMVEGVATRLGKTYRDRIYINHLGVYSSIDALRKAVDYLDITKQDE